MRLCVLPWKINRFARAPLNGSPLLQVSMGANDQRLLTSFGQWAWAQSNVRAGLVMRTSSNQESHAEVVNDGHTRREKLFLLCTDSSEWASETNGGCWLLFCFFPWWQKSQTQCPQFFQSIKVWRTTKVPPPQPIATNFGIETSKKLLKTAISFERNFSQCMAWSVWKIPSQAANETESCCSLMKSKVESKSNKRDSKDVEGVEVAIKWSDELRQVLRSPKWLVTQLNECSRPNKMGQGSTDTQSCSQQMLTRTNAVKFVILSGKLGSSSQVWGVPARVTDWRIPVFFSDEPEMIETMSPRQSSGCFRGIERVDW